jgi:thiosulfate/3-mercaptopyruvate sulfurtransferase
LISAAELAGRLNAFHVYDIRWSLADPDHGRDSFLRGHIPGAVFVDLDTDLAAPPSTDGRHPLPSPAEFAATLGRLGLSPADPAVVYDDSGGSVAARMWWMLKAIGHHETLVLDGGFQAWVDDGMAVEIGDRIPEAATYPVPDGYEGVVGWDDLEGRRLIDARAAERYRGDFEPVDPKAGHIPGAVNLPYADNLYHSGRFLDPEALAQRFKDIGAKPVVYCGSGVNACHLALAMEIAGKEPPDLYAGSFSEWARRDLPVETSG